MRTTTIRSIKITAVLAVTRVAGGLAGEDSYKAWGRATESLKCSRLIRWSMMMGDMMRAGVAGVARKVLRSYYWEWEMDDGAGLESGLFITTHQLGCPSDRE